MSITEGVSTGNKVYLCMRFRRRNPIDREIWKKRQSKHKNMYSDKVKPVSNEMPRATEFHALDLDTYYNKSLSWHVMNLM